MVCSAGHVPAEQTIQMAEGEALRLTLKLVPTPPVARPAVSASSAVVLRPGRPADSAAVPSLGPTLMWVGFSVGGAALLTGTITGLMSSSRTSDIKDQCAGNVCPASLSGEADSARTLATVSNVSFALAAVGVGVGLYGLFTTPDAPAAAPSTARRWRLDVGPGAALVRGSF
ncbi:MAG: hypothetical protein EOO75_14165 [Myxococcales bacterium]|nr:MAG: hypothetical protein EOO75_14165 [Myxococcales bacterium]